MLIFSFPSVYTALLTGNLILVTLTFFLFRRKSLVNFSLTGLGIFFILVVTRMFFPFELPITTNIYFPKPVSKVISDFLHPRFTIGEHVYAFWDFFVLIWFLVFLVLFFRFLSAAHKFHHFMQTNGKSVDPTDIRQLTLNRILKEESAKKRISLLSLSDLQTPLVYRHRLQYWIVLPESLDVSEKELFFILKHELAHIRHHDLTLKTMISVLCMFYWWNPLNYFLKRNTSLLLELRIDRVLAHSQDATAAYLECLLKVAKQSAPALSSPNALTFCTSNRSLLAKRFEILLQQKQKGMQDNLKKSIPVLVSVVLYIGSFFFILEPKYISPEVEEYAFELTEENAYAVENPDGSYDLFLLGEYLETVDSLEYYSEDLPVY